MAGLNPYPRSSEETRQASGATISWLLLIGAAGIFVFSLVHAWSSPSVGPADVLALSGTGTVEYRQFAPVIAGERQAVECDFNLHNDSPEPLTIVQVSKSCTCTTVSFDGQPLTSGVVIPPGESPPLRMRVDLHGRSGEVAADCSITVDSNRTHRCQLTGHVYERLAFSSNYHNLGEVPAQQPLSAPFELTTCGRSADPPDPRIRTNDPDESVLTCSSNEVSHLVGDLYQRTIRGHVTVTPQAVAGPAHTTMTAEIDGDGTTQFTRTYTIAWTLVGPYDLAPRTVFFRPGSGDTSTSILRSHVTVRMHDGRDFSVLDASVTGSMPLQVDSPGRAVSGAEHRVDLALETMRLKEGFSSAQVVVRTDQSDWPQFSIPVSAINGDSLRNEDAGGVAAAGR